VSGWLLDTNVISELRRPRPDPNVVQFVAAQPFDLLHVSVVAFAEIRFGIEVATDLSRRIELSHWLLHTARPMFANRVLEVTEDILVTWRLLVEEGRKTGHTFAQPDLIIAATALQHGLTVVSRNTRDFEKANVSVFNPWT
jgi:predicted nucleic acid-binding protein